MMLVVGDGFWERRFTTAQHDEAWRQTYAMFDALRLGPQSEHQEAQKTFEAQMRAQGFRPASPEAEKIIMATEEPELHDRPVSKRIIDEWMRRV